ncbi:MAG: pentapeptide repeat-containing protein [Methylocystaceae bacterium]|nr:MAG: pentapeptide repeat-containing protein [Methylocystaceae bacterium]KAF0210131.1 MAG: pentapeptide repeat-containing [Methylocystaceae bacterium]TXT43770.1 MAG: pentapeptide repeat-containing protein [Methylocystaceae bacterium]
MAAAIRTEQREAFKIDLSGAFIRRTDLSNANLKGANLSDADCTNVNFRGANLQNAILDGTILRGADLTGVRNLTRSQIARAIIDDRTILPSELPE